MPRGLLAVGMARLEEVAIARFPLGLRSAVSLVVDFSITVTPTK